MHIELLNLIDEENEYQYSCIKSAMHNMWSYWHIYWSVKMKLDTFLNYFDDHMKIGF